MTRPCALMLNSEESGDKKRAGAGVVSKRSQRGIPKTLVRVHFSTQLHSIQLLLLYFNKIYVPQKKKKLHSRIFVACPGLCPFSQDKRAPPKPSPTICLPPKWLVSFRLAATTSKKGCLKTRSARFSWHATWVMLDSL